MVKIFSRLIISIISEDIKRGYFKNLTVGFSEKKMQLVTLNEAALLAISK